MDDRARGKRRGFSPAAAAHHSPSARVNTEFSKIHFFPRKKRVEPVQERKGKKQDLESAANTGSTRENRGKTGFLVGFVRVGSGCRRVARGSCGSACRLPRYSPDDPC